MSGPTITQKKPDTPVLMNQTSRPVWLLPGLGLFWLLVTLPTILWSNWFPLDMPALFEMGEYLHKWLPWIVSPHSGSGRYFPLYWLYHTLQFLLFGANVWPYFLILSLIYLTGVYVTCRTLWRATGSWFLSGLLFLLLYLNTPTPENIATIGKGEPLAFGVIACLIATLYSSVVSNGVKKSSFFIFSACFVISIWIKETSLVLWVMAIWSFAACWVLGRIDSRYKSATPARPYALLLGGLVAGWALSRLPYFIFTKTSNQPSYTSYDITLALVKDNFDFYINQQPDILIFGVLSTVLLSVSVTQQMRKMKRQGDAYDMRIVVFFSGVCMMGWAYYLGMLLWRWPMAYYLLLPSIAFKLCSLYGLHFLLKTRSIKKWALIFPGILITASLIYGALSFYYVTTSQIAYSRVYTSALQEFAKLSGGNAPLIVESYPFYAEQIGGTGAFLKNQLNVKTPVTGIGEILDPAALKPSILDLLQVTPRMLEENVEKLPRRGSYVLVFTGDKLATWFLRGVTPYFNEESLLKKEGVYEMDLVSEKSISSPAVYLHEWTNMLTAGPTSIGYKLYRVTNDVPKFLWLGRYPDGWVSLKSSLKIDSTYGLPVALKISVPQITLPNQVRIFKDGVLYKEIHFTTPDEISLDLGTTFSKTTQLTFEVDHAFSPKDIKMNKDDRLLGARIALTPPVLTPATSIKN